MLDDTGIISMQDCAERDSHSELCQCDWIIHIEEGEAVGIKYCQQRL